MHEISIVIDKEYDGKLVHELPIAGSLTHDEDGRPILTGMPGTHISISHSGNYWTCAYGEVPVGVDIQIAKSEYPRHVYEGRLTEAERAYVDANGSKGFYEIWTMFEAYLKLTGAGLFSEIPEMCDCDAKLLDEIMLKSGEHVFFERLYSLENAAFSVATFEKIKLKTM